MLCKNNLRPLRWRQVLFVFGSLWVFVVLTLLSPCGASSAVSPAIGSTDVHRLTQILRAELELVRLEMGEPLVSHPAGQVARVAPREVYFQALTLFRKVNRLSFELIRETTADLEPPPVEIRPRHVYAVVEKALIQLRRVKHQLGIFEKIPPSTLRSEMSPADVFQAIVKANRQLNTMLEQRFEPGDVYQEVTRALSYTTSLRGLFPRPQIPDMPAFERRKVPADVYRELLESINIVRKIIEKSGFFMMEFKPLETDSITPSDVFDVASLLVAELVFLHSQAPGATLPRKVYPPGEKFPSHVYQRARLLRAALNDLLVLVQKNPTWLENHKGQR